MILNTILTYYCVFVLCVCMVCMCMYLHAHVCTSVHAHVFVQVRRHEVDFQCLPEFLYSSHFFFFVMLRIKPGPENGKQTLYLSYMQSLYFFGSMVSHRTWSSPLWLEQLGRKFQRSSYGHFPRARIRGVWRHGKYIINTHFKYR